MIIMFLNPHPLYSLSQQYTVQLIAGKYVSKKSKIGSMKPAHIPTQ